VYTFRFANILSSPRPTLPASVLATAIKRMEIEEKSEMKNDYARIKRVEEETTSLFTAFAQFFNGKVTSGYQVQYIFKYNQVEFILTIL